MEALRGGAASFGGNVSRETLPSDTRARLEAYAALLLTWNRTINLVSRKDEGAFWERHIEDALQLRHHMPQRVDRAIDLGSGGGLPGLVLAIATDCAFDLIESDHRKAAFLREAARVCGAKVVVHAARIEAVTLPPAQLVTARALAPLAVLIGLAEPFLAADGVLLAPKGVNAEAELTAAREQWHMQVSRAPSTTQAGATLLKITEVSRVGRAI